MISKSDSLKDFFNATIRSCDSFDELCIEFSQQRYQILSNSKSLIQKLSQYFKDFVLAPSVTNSARYSQTVYFIQAPAPAINEKDLILKQPEPGKKKIKEEYFDTNDGRLVKKRLTGMVFVFGKDFHMGIGPCVENDNQVVNFINNRFIELRLNQNYLLGHAAAITHKHKGIAIAGFSGMGKSTLSLEIMKHGVNFISNDRILFKCHGSKVQLEGVAKHPRVNPGTILNNQNLSQLILPEQLARYINMGDSLWELEEKHDAIIETCFGPGRFQLESTLDLQILLNWNRNATKEFTVTPIEIQSRTDLLPALMKAPGLFYFHHHDAPIFTCSEQSYVDCLKHTQVVEFSGRTDFRKGAQYCLDFFNS